MRRIAFFLSFLIFLLLPATGFSQTTLKLMTFNIYHGGATMSGNYDMDLIANVIKNEKPDLVALQEVDFHTNRAKGYDVTSELGIRCGMAPLFGKTMDYNGGEYGIAVLSRYPILESRRVELPHKQDEEPRIALMIKVAVSSDTIWFISTHFGYKYEDVQMQQAEKINQMVSSLHYPVALGGDLNAEPASRPIKYMEETWLRTYDPQDPGLTFPSSGPVKKIDFIMCYPAGRWTVLSDKVIQNGEASDHFAYMTTVQLNK
jgi:endonuclease/exonuclease/phosphatase family metal-dependent hydrolase